MQPARTSGWRPSPRRTCRTSLEWRAGGIDRSRRQRLCRDTAVQRRADLQAPHCRRHIKISGTPVSCERPCCWMWRAPSPAFSRMAVTGTIALRHVQCARPHDALRRRIEPRLLSPIRSLSARCRQARAGRKDIHRLLSIGPIICTARCKGRKASPSLVGRPPSTPLGKDERMEGSGNQRSRSERQPLRRLRISLNPSANVRCPVRRT